VKGFFRGKSFIVYEHGIFFSLLLWLQAEGAFCLGCQSLFIVITQIKYGIVDCGEEGTESFFYL